MDTFKKAARISIAALVLGAALASAAEQTPEAAVEDYVKAWAEPDPERRRALLEQAWSTDGVYVDPSAEVKGRDALVAHIGGFLAQGNGARIERTSGVDSHHGNRLRFSWRMVTAEGKTMAEGIDYGELDATGQLELIVGFFGRFPPISGSADR